MKRFQRDSTGISSTDRYDRKMIKLEKMCTPLSHAGLQSTKTEIF